ncbi:unnamed protein product [Closterium sp. NIES-54]
MTGGVAVGTRNVEKRAVADEGVALLDHGLDPERCIKTSKCLLIGAGLIDGGGDGEEKRGPECPVRCLHRLNASCPRIAPAAQRLPCALPATSVLPHAPPARADRALPRAHLPCPTRQPCAARERLPCAPPATRELPAHRPCCPAPALRSTSNPRAARTDHALPRTHIPCPTCQPCATRECLPCTPPATPSCPVRCLRRLHASCPCTALAALRRPLPALLAMPTARATAKLPTVLLLLLLRCYYC